MDNQHINEKTDEILKQVARVTDRLYTRVERIKFNNDSFTSSDIEDLRLHLGYTKNYSDLAKVRLQYMKISGS